MFDFNYFTPTKVVFGKNKETQVADLIKEFGGTKILIYAILKTGLAEEIVFRGFLLKRISNKFGFAAGNLIQSLLFGIMHGIFFFNTVGVAKAVLIILFTGTIGWVMGFINEKKAGGSILPSWFVHSSANIFSGICSAFLLI